MSTLTDDPPPVPFDAHTARLRGFLVARDAIVARIEGVLNAQRKPVGYLSDRHGLSRRFEDCFFAAEGGGAGQSLPRRALDEAHWASGFRPRRVDDLHNDLIDPAEMMVRGFHCWQQTRWPGRNGRVRYAETLFNVYLTRQLELLSMRIRDAGVADAAARLDEVQALLDALWSGSPADQPVLVRDARWLIPLAQSPTTDELAAYFDVARDVTESLAAEDRIEVCKAAVQMIGGHLRSQIRHYCVQDRVPIDEKSVILRTRTSNALDLALLIQYLVPLLEAYEQALQAGGADYGGSRHGAGVRDGDGDRDRDGGERRDDSGVREVAVRRALASAICQGISPDPELFVGRLDLLGPYGMVEYLFIASEPDGTARYTDTGSRHVRSLRRFETLIRRLSKPLHDDCEGFRPRDGAYSPYGAIFGTPSNLTEHMALKALQRDAETRFSIEDVFADGGADKLDWVNGWRKLPHIDPALQRLHEFPQAFAEAIFERIERALSSASSGGEADGLPPIGRLAVATEAESTAASIPPLSPSFVVASDRAFVAAGTAEPRDEQQLLRDRLEGHYLLSCRTEGGWVAIRKDCLTEVLGAGRDAKVVGLPASAADVLRLMFPAPVEAPPPADAPGQSDTPPQAGAPPQADAPPSTSNA